MCYSLLSSYADGFFIYEDLKTFSDAYLMKYSSDYDFNKVSFDFGLWETWLFYFISFLY